MKKQLLLFSALLSLLLLTGCTKQLTEEPLNLSFPAETASFTGTFTKDTYTGVVQGSGWCFEGTLTAERLLTGEGENVPCRAALFGSVEEGTYTGSLVSGMPDGKGEFRLSSGAVFTGVFSGGTAVRGESANLPWEFQHGGSRFSGTYTGALESSGPEGEGLFGGMNAAGQQFTWYGSWSGGEIAGSGVLTDEHCVVSVEGRETAGSYAGDGKDGLPDGEGVFTAESESGIPFTYTGEWAAGIMDGEGTLSYDAEALYTRTGTFTAGRFTPDGLETLVSLGTCEPVFTLTESQLAALRETTDLWERTDHQDFFNSVYKELFTKNAWIGQCFADDSFREEPYWMEVYSMRIITAHTGALVPGGAEMTCIFAADRNYQYPCFVIVPGSVDRLTQGNTFHVYAMPLAVSSYVNTLGETREALVLLAGDIYTGM